MGEQRDRHKSVSALSEELARQFPLVEKLRTEGRQKAASKEDRKLIGMLEEFAERIESKQAWGRTYGAMRKRKIVLNNGLTIVFGSEMV